MFQKVTLGVRVLVLTILGVLVLSACTFLQKPSPQTPAEPVNTMSLKPSDLLYGNRNPAFWFFGPKKLKAEEIVETSSSGALKVDHARVIVDNDASFDTKIQAIKSAKSGETIRIAYFIYSEDHSSAQFSEELLAAATRGVNVKILVDYITNYKLLDLFSHLESQSRGRIQVRFYNRPSDLVLRDLVFMTQPCPQNTPITPKACSDFKWKNIDVKNKDFYSQLLLAGMYSHNVTALSTAVLRGGMIDVKKFTDGAKATEEEQKQLLEFFKLVYDSRIKGDKIAAIKVMIALKMYGDKLNPIMYEVFGRIPLDQMGESSFQDWEHITDFIHHKVLIVGDRFVQLGGRNIENSYHMKPNNLTAKYIFMDTDMAADISRGGDRIAKSYDDLWDFKAMTIDIDDIYANQPIDFVMNPAAAKLAVATCTPKEFKSLSDRSQFANCVQAELPKAAGFKDLQARRLEKADTMAKNAATYRTEYEPKKLYTKTWKSGAEFNDELDKKDVESALIAYIENVHYDKSLPVEKRKRKYGNEVGKERKYGKYIHHLWAKGLENVCTVASEELKENPNAKPKRVIFHSAYFLPPAGLLRPLSKMMDGTWDCKNVHMTFLTNSFETTDLNYINVVARYEMLAFFQIYANRKGLYGEYNSSRSARIDYYEYNKSTEASGVSLHTKLSILGDDAIIGSANADVRTYFMDTNNGFYLRNAKSFVKEYSQWIDGILADSSKTKNLSDGLMSGSVTKDQLMKEDEMMLNVLLAKWKPAGKLSPKVRQNIFDFAKSAGKFTMETTQKILSKQYIEAYGENEQQVDQEKLKEQMEMERKFNRFLQLL